MYALEFSLKELEGMIVEGGWCRCRFVPVKEGNGGLNDEEGPLVSLTDD